MPVYRVLNYCTIVQLVETLYAVTRGGRYISIGYPQDDNKKQTNIKIYVYRRFTSFQYVDVHTLSVTKQTISKRHGQYLHIRV